MTTTGSRPFGRRVVAAAAVAVALLTLAPGPSPPAGALTPPAPDDAWVVAVYGDVLDRSVSGQIRLFAGT